MLLLPALSSISTRHEMWPLQERLSSHYRTVSVDWPGFGDQPRPAIDWTPDAYSAFLEHVLDTIAPRPHAVIAAGHGATLRACPCLQPNRLVRTACAAGSDLARTSADHDEWTPAFPRSALQGCRPAGGRTGAVQADVNRLVVRFTAAGHVCADPAWLTGELLRGKLAVTWAAGVRHASIRFVTGELDPLETREQFLALARRSGIPMLMVYGNQTPPRSRAEMEAIAKVDTIQSSCLPEGKLSLYEEFAAEVADAVAPFLAAGP